LSGVEPLGGPYAPAPAVAAAGRGRGRSCQELTKPVDGDNADRLLPRKHGLEHGRKDGSAKAKIKEETVRREGQEGRVGKIRKARKVRKVRKIRTLSSIRPNKINKINKIIRS
jgi:hypothetical protein